MAEKRKIHRVVDAQGTLVQVLPETSAEQVTLADTANNFTSTNVEGALAEVMQVAQTGGVTGVKGDAETAYRKGNVNITKANIGLGNVDNTADANKVVKEAGKTTRALRVVGNDSTNSEKSITFDGSADKEVTFNNGDFVTTLTGSNLQVAIADKGYATKTYVDTQDGKKLDKTGGTITGNLSVNGGVTVGGNLTVNGTTTTIDSTTLQVKDKLIEVAHGNTTKLTSPAGLVVPKYDGTNSGALVFDGDGMAQVGKVVLDAAGNIDTTKSGLQTLATRTNLVGGNLVQYDSTNKTLVDSKKKVGDFALKTDIPTNYVTTDTEQTITARKRFNDEIDVNRIKSLLGTPICTMDGRDLHIGSFAYTTYIRGGDGTPRRPQYEYQVSDGTTISVVTKSIALIDDIKTTKVDNAVNADTATTASKVANKLIVTFTDEIGGYIVQYDGSTSQTLNFIPTAFNFTRATSTSPMDIDLRNTGVTAGSYSAVTVDAKGRVTAGGESVEWGTTGQNAPSNDLMVGGLFFELQ
jgi:hypothetical protein|nr:MAG TPA: hypothetical protein [Bacteriophage sp.]